MRNFLPGLSTNIPQELTGARFGVQVFGATGTFTLPSGVTSVTAMVIAIGGGGGGASGASNAPAGVGTAGSTGGTTSFGSLASAVGGDGGVVGGPSNPINTGGWALGNVGTRVIVGANANTLVPGINGATGFWGLGSGGDSGHANLAASSDVTGGASGNSGTVATYFGTVTASQTVTIGAGGTGGSAVAAAGGGSGMAGQKGAPGAVIVFYWW